MYKKGGRNASFFYARNFLCFILCKLDNTVIFALGKQINLNKPIMKKILLCAAIAVFGLSNVRAQDADTKSNDVKFGVTAGFVSVTERAKADGTAVSQSDSGFYVGVLADFVLSEKLNLQPEVIYANISDSGLLYIPVLLKYKVAEKFNLLAGPQATLILDETPDEFNSFGIDLSFGASYDIDAHFFVDARYAFELTNRYNANDYDLTDKVNSLTVGLGYKF